MAVNTLLWSLSYAEIRKIHPKQEVERHLQVALEAIYLASIKWPGVESALELYVTFVEACLRAYDGADNMSYSPQPTLARSTTSIDDAGRISAPCDLERQVLSSNGLTAIPYSSKEAPPLIRRLRNEQDMSNVPLPFRDSRQIFGDSADPSLFAASFDPNSYANPFPSLLIGAHDTFAFANMYDRGFLLDTVGDSYPQNLQPVAVPQQPMDGLNLEQQSELMGNLESIGLTGLLRENSPPDFFLGLGR